MRRAEGQAAVLAVVPGFDADTADDLLADASGWLLNLSGPGLHRPVEQLRRSGVISDVAGVLRVAEPLRSELRSTLAQENPEVFAAAVESLRPHAGNGLYQALSRMLGSPATDLHLAILELQSAPDDAEVRNALIELLQRPSSIARGVDASITAQQLVAVGSGRPHVDRMLQFVRALDLWRVGRRRQASDLFENVLKAGTRDLAHAISGHLFGVFQIAEGNLPAAERAISDCISVLRSLRSDHGLAMALTSLGRALRIQAALGDEKNSNRTPDELLVAAATALTESIDLHGASGDVSGLAHAYHEFARVREMEGDIEGATELALSALDSARLPQDRLESLILLGGIYRDSGRTGDANSCLNDAAKLARQAGISDLTLARLLNVQASAERRAGRAQAAVSHARESLRIGRELRNRRHAAHAEHTLAAALIDIGTTQSLAEATRLLNSSLRTLSDMGDGAGEAMVRRTLTRVSEEGSEGTRRNWKGRRKPK